MAWPYFHYRAKPYTAAPKQHLRALRKLTAGSWIRDNIFKWFTLLQPELDSSKMPVEAQYHGLLKKQIGGRIFEKIISQSNIDAFNGAQDRILYILWERDHIPIIELSSKTGLAKTTLTSMLDRMEASGLITRIYDKSDRRKILIAIAPKAKSLQADYDKVSAKMNEIYYRGFSDDEIIQFEDYLIGLFCWISYYWDSELGVMACIGGDKLTKDRIHSTGIFSANLVTESILPLADYFGNTEGYNSDKMNIPLETTKGSVLNVPILDSSPLAFELEVSRAIPLDGGEVFLCKIRNVLVNEELTDENKSLEQCMKEIAPVRTTRATYFSWSGDALGKWGELMKSFKR